MCYRARISNLMIKIGVKEDNFEQFLSETYTKCESCGITPGKIALHVDDLARFSDNAKLPEIEEYLREKIVEMMILNDQRHGLVHDISNLEEQKLQIERDRDELLAKKKEIGEEIENYHKAIQQLDSYGLNMTDFQEYAKTIQGMKELGFDIMIIVSGFYEAANFKRDKDRLTAEF
jgi:DNA-directed RNA polymerase specialized sigma54-like protein